MDLIGLDGKRFIQGKFQALIGVGITINEKHLSDFIKTYDNFMQELFQESSIDKRRPIYKAYDLKSLFYIQGKEPISKFVEATKDKIDFIDFYYSYFIRKTNENGIKDKPTEFINIYHEEPTGIEKVNAIKFLNIIEPSYSAICCWGQIQKNPKLCSNSTFYVDNFQSSPSKMWEQISKLKNLNIVYNGGKCNYLISAADLYLVFLEEQIKKNNLHLNRETHKILHQHFTGKFETQFLGTQYLYQLAPAKKANVRTISNVKHPIYYVFTEGQEMFQKTFGNKKSEQLFLEQSPFLDKVFELATKNKGSVKFYDVSQDNSFITKEDKFYYYGDAGKQKIEMLKRTGFKNEIYYSENLQ